MRSLRRISLAEQTAAHLRRELEQGRWQGYLPGVARLAKELRISRDTVQGALRLLEAEGLLGAQGRGRSRTITRLGSASRRPRLGILLYDALPQEGPQVSQLLLQIEIELEAAGFDVFFPAETQAQLGHDVRRLAAVVKAHPADAWVVVAGSRPLLRWFARQTVPCLALFGRTDGLSLARVGPDKVPAYLAAVRKLIALGHRRIVLITRRPRRKPFPWRAERAFLDELAAHRIPAGQYNLPDWEETPEGLNSLLENLFRVTPPTAVIADETPLVVATGQFLLRHGLAVPEDVSLMATDFDASLQWCHPVIAHIRWEVAPVVRQILRWAASVKRGRPKRDNCTSPAEFIPGGSIGKAPR